jgi:hypothetical protein
MKLENVVVQAMYRKYLITLGCNSRLFGSLTTLYEYRIWAQKHVLSQFGQIGYQRDQMLDEIFKHKLPSDAPLKCYTRRTDLKIKISSKIKAFCGITL